MELDLNTFLTTVDCIVDDLYTTQFAPAKPTRPGKAPDLSDSEVLTLARLAHCHPSRSEPALARYAAKQWRADFPRLLHPSTFNRRGRDLHGVLAALGPALARHLSSQVQLRLPDEVLDGIPVPVMARCRGNRHRCFANEVGIGCGGSDRDWYDGVQLVARVTPSGLRSGGTVGPAATEERWVADALLRWRTAPQAIAPTLVEVAEPLFGHDHAGRGRLGPPGPRGPAAGAGHAVGAPVVAELGFSGVNWHEHWEQDSQVKVRTKAVSDGRADEEERRAGNRAFSGARQVVETVGQWLCARFGLKRPRGRSCWGLLTRLAAKVAAFNLGVYLNHLYDRPTFAFFDPFE